LRADASSVAEEPTGTDTVFPPIETLAMTVLLLVEPVVPGEVGELPPPPPHALMPASRITGSSRRTSALGELVFGMVTALPCRWDIMSPVYGIFL
jgi:hypothetical protein